MQCFLIILPYGSMYDVKDTGPGTDRYDILSRVPIYMLSSVLVYIEREVLQVCGPLKSLKNTVDYYGIYILTIL